MGFDVKVNVETHFVVKVVAQGDGFLFVGHVCRVCDSVGGDKGTNDAEERQKGVEGLRTQLPVFVSGISDSNASNNSRRF